MDNTFQVAVLGFFILFGVVGVGLFAAGSLGGDSDQPSVSFSVWGEWNDSDFTALLEESGVADNDLINISYTSVQSSSFEDELVNALARGEGPDVLLISHTKLLPLKDLITPVGEEYYSQRRFRNTFVEGSEVFVSNRGIVGLPIAVDPVVMYWNRDLFTENNLVSPPEFWETVPQQARRITETDQRGDMVTAGIGLGSASTISYPKNILSSLFLQAGNNIVSGRENGEYESVLGDGGQGDITSAESAVRMYTQFANPAGDTYVWSNSLSSDRSAFSAGDLGMYLAPASEISTIRSENPNLNFDVTGIPQLKDGERRTYGEFYGFSILDKAANKQLILNALDQITADRSVANEIARQTQYAPVHKQAISTGGGNPYLQVFYDAAIISRGWPDPNPSATQEIFKDIINDVTSGRSDSSEAIDSADTKMINLLEDVVTE